MTPGRVTVVIPTFDRPTFLDRSVRSVLDQSWPDVELIVVDDCSTGPVSVPPGVNVVRHPRNLGLASARNTGLAHATGELIMFLDDDDWIHPDRLRWAAEGIGSAPAHMCLSVMVMPDGSERATQQRHSGDMRLTFGHQACPHVSQVVFRRDHVVQFDPSFRYGDGEDVEWWMRMTHAAVFAFTDRVGHYYQVHDELHVGRHPIVLARRTIILRHWASSDRITRSRFLARLAVAHAKSGHRLRACLWATASTVVRPSMKGLRTVVRLAVQRGGEPRPEQ